MEGTGTTATSSPTSRGSAPTTAVVGAGIAGLACARRIAARGTLLVLFDKGRRPGGRASTRGAGAQAFDHGAQYLTARDPGFLREVESWRRAGIAAEWHGRIGVLARGAALPGACTTRRFVGTPGMGAIAQHLARGLDVRCGERVVRVMGIPGAWMLATASGGDHGPFERVVVTAPAPQAAELLRSASPEIAARLATLRVRPCWALLVDFAEALPLALDAAFVNAAPLAWIARESSKPGRAEGARWILHATPGWTETHLELEPQQVARLLLDALREVLAAKLPPTRAATAHLWRFAMPDPALPERCLFDPDSGIGVCGDALGGPRVEGAWLSGVALADLLVRA